jgi:KDO2-lipid IV(A) lauroyltransferase
MASTQWLAWWLVSGIIRRLPARVSYSVAGALGHAAYYTWPRGRRNTQRNYRRVLRDASPREVARVARASLVNYFRYLADFIRFPDRTQMDLAAAVAPDDCFEQLDGALERGRGAVVVCTHFGNWDVGAGGAAARGFPITVVAETFRDRRLDRAVRAMRERLGMKIIKLESAGPSLMRTLRNNGVLALLIDRPLDGRGVRVDFFGEPVEVPAGPARLALRTGAALVPTAFVRTGRYGERVTPLTDFGIDCAATGDEDADIRRVTQAIMHAHEGFIRAHPDQWYMFREMWPSRRGVAAPA